MNVSSPRQNPSALRLQTQELSFSRGGDSFQVGAGRGPQLQKLLEGAMALLKSLQALQKMMPATQAGGAQPGKGVGGAPSAPSPFETSSFTPACGKGRAPVELNPGASPMSPAGEARLGGGLPPALAQYKGAIESASAKTGVPASMLAAQIWQESRGNLSATSTNGGNGLTDTGLMQINPNTFKELQAKHPELQGKDLSDPETNILAGAFYMKDMKEQFGSWDLALRAYNSGPNGVDRSNPNAIPAGTGDATYVQKVKQFADIIATGRGSLPA